jgi:hypothetical protein
MGDFFLDLAANSGEGASLVAHDEVRFSLNGFISGS